MTAGETRNPSRNMPRVIRRVFWRILIFYFLTTLLIGFNIPYNYPGLSTRAVTVSPFTLVFQQAGAKAAGGFMNGVILTSVISAGNHAAFAGSRILYGLAVTGQAPAIFRRTTKTGVPWLAVLLTMSGGGICFGLSFLPGGAGELWVWLQALVGVSNQIAWWSIGIASWRFRAAWKAQGRKISELRFPNPAGRFAAPIVVFSTTVIILIQGWSSFAPFSTIDFLQSYSECGIRASEHADERSQSICPFLLSSILFGGPSSGRGRHRSQRSISSHRVTSIRKTMLATTRRSSEGNTARLESSGACTATSPEGGSPDYLNVFSTATVQAHARSNCKTAHRS